MLKSPSETIDSFRRESKDNMESLKKESNERIAGLEQQKNNSSKAKSKKRIIPPKFFSKIYKKSLEKNHKQPNKLKQDCRDIVTLVIFDDCSKNY